MRKGKTAREALEMSRAAFPHAVAGPDASSVPHGVTVRPQDYRWPRAS